MTVEHYDRRLNAPMFYTVQAGDTLHAIASRYGVSVQALMQANQLTGGTIYVGQTLRIPVSAGGVFPPASSSPPQGFPFPFPPSGQRLEERVDRLERQYATIEAEVDRLRQRVRRLEQQGS